MSFRLLLAALAPLVLAAQQLPIEGLPDAAVRVLIYEDLQCSDCATFREMLDQHLLPRYGPKVAFIHRDFPLAKHAWARKAAVAGRFFAEKDPKTALEFRRHVLGALRQINASNFNEKLAAFAEGRGIPGKQAVAALENAAYAEAVEKDFQDGVARGVSKTPTVLVNGTPFIETFTLEEISKGIEKALAEAH